MTILLVGIHVLVCLFLIFVVLLQSAQAADLAGAFGGGGSQTALGMRGATTILHKATTGAAVVFMLTSLALGLMGGQEGASVIEGLEDPNAPAVMTPEGAAGDTEGENEDEQGAGAGEIDGEGEASGEQGEASAADQEEGTDGSSQQEDGAGP